MYERTERGSMLILRNRYATKLTAEGILKVHSCPFFFFFGRNGDTSLIHGMRGDRFCQLTMIHIM